MTKLIHPLRFASSVVPRILIPAIFCSDNSACDISMASCLSMSCRPVFSVHSSAAASPTASAEATVPASNFRGSSAHVKSCSVTLWIMSPPPRNGGIFCRSSAFPYSTPIPVGPYVLWPEKAKKSQSSFCTSMTACAACCEASTRTAAPFLCARSMISFSGCIVPSTLLSPLTDTSFVVPFSRIFLVSLRSINPSAVIGNQSSPMPCRFSSCIHGTMLLWCSSIEIAIRSFFCRVSPKLCATRLMASVAFFVKMISYACCAFKNFRTMSRALSCITVASSASACTPRLTFAFFVT